MNRLKQRKEKEVKDKKIKEKESVNSIKTSEIDTIVDNILKYGDSSTKDHLIQLLVSKVKQDSQNSIHQNIGLLNHNLIVKTPIINNTPVSTIVPGAPMITPTENSN